MALCHTDRILESPAIQRLGQFIRDRRHQWALSTPDFERFEHELHEQFQAIECEFLAEALARYDVSADEIEVSGVTYRPTLTSSETYLLAAGPVKVTRHLYRPAGRRSKRICPWEGRAGIIRGHFTPRAARQAAFVTAHLTPGESEARFEELEGMRPSRSNWDRLPKELSRHWESQRPDWEAAVRSQDTLPDQVTVLAISVDGVFERLKTLLKEADAGAEQVIRVLKYQRSRARGNKQTRVDAALTYFRHQRRRMHYADYVRKKLPIASGVMEARGKTLVTQRLKRSGMAWTRQAVRRS